MKSKTERQVFKAYEKFYKKRGWVKDRFRGMTLPIKKRKENENQMSDM